MAYCQFLIFKIFDKIAIDIAYKIISGLAFLSKN